MRLWEAKHAYYCSDSNYYAGGPDFGGAVYETWEDFIEEFGDADMDYNLVFRWDWKDEATVQDDYGDEAEHEGGVLNIYIIAQRKGNFIPVAVWGMKPEHEEAVKDFLRPRLAHLLSLWEPLTPA